MTQCNWLRRSIWLLIALLSSTTALPKPTVALPIAQQQPQQKPLQTLIDEGRRLLDKDGSETAIQQAFTKFTEALNLSRKVGDRPQQAWALLGIGEYHFRLDAPGKALDALTQALALFRAIGDRKGEAKTLEMFGVISHSQGEQHQAQNYHQQALNLWKNLGDRQGQADALLGLGASYFLPPENDQKALQYYLQALPLFQEARDTAGENISLGVVAALYSKLGEKHKALEYYQQALSLSQRISDRSTEVNTLSAMIGVYNSLGDKQAELDYTLRSLAVLQAGNEIARRRFGEESLRQGVADFSNSKGPLESLVLPMGTDAFDRFQAISDRVSEPLVLQGIGRLYAGLGEPQRALETYNQALAVVKRDLGDHPRKLFIFRDIGLLYADLGNLEKAIEYYTQALQLWPASDAVGAGSAFLGMARLQSRAGNQKLAADYYQKALKHYDDYRQMFPKDPNDPPNSFDINELISLGQIYWGLGDRKKALEYFQRSLFPIQALGNHNSEILSRWYLAQIYQQRQQPTEALQQINVAIDLIEKLRSTLKDDQLKTSYFATVQRYYQFKIDLLMQLHQQDPTKGYDKLAFETSDQSRARVLRDLLTEASANIRRNISPQLQEREQILQALLNDREKELIQISGRPNSEATIQTLRNEIAKLLRQQQELTTEIRRNNPDYANLKYPKPTAFSAIQNQLDEDTLLLQYSLGDTNSYLWVVSKTSLQTYILPKRSDLEPAIKAFRTALLDLTEETRLPNIAQTLSQQILAPAATQLQQKRRLLIVADGALHQIPFAALPTPSRIAQIVQPQPTLHPLLETHTISYLPSATLIFPQHPNRPTAPKTIAILADPIFSPNDDRLKPSTPTPPSPSPTTNTITFIEPILRDRAARNLSFSRLPGTAIEAQAIQRLVANPEDQTTVFGFDSTYAWTTNPKLNQYRYLHLATHGIFDQERPELSSLILSLYNTKGEAQKGFLRLPELFNLDFPAEMITLSACQTGLGNSVPGEGLIGMTRGLMYAGAKRVTVSLWSVPDTETAQLMEQFYRHLLDISEKGVGSPTQRDSQHLFRKTLLDTSGKANFSHTEALRSAQLAMWKRGLHPYYWSAFILQGEWRN